MPGHAAANGGITLRELGLRPVSDLRDVGPKLAPRLAAMGIESVLDLLTHYPRRYHDRTNRAEIASVEVGEEVTIDAEVRRIRSRPMRDRRRKMVEADVYDGTGLLHVVFFNQPYRERQLEEGTEASFFGKVELFRGKRQMTNPVVDVLANPGTARTAAEAGESTGRLVPVYPASGKADVHSWQLARIVRAALDRTRARGFADPIDDQERRDKGLVDRTTAFWGIHRPESIDDFYTAAHRLKFDEFLRMQVGLVARKRALERDRNGIAQCVGGPLVPLFHSALPFPLTADQRRAIDEIMRDLAGHAPMHRLLQGEVGSGKTVVALTALLVAVQGGYQGAFMAPTEVLAEQHDLTLRRLLDGLTVPDPGSLLGGAPRACRAVDQSHDRRRPPPLARGLASGDVDIVVGTHALIYEGVEFARLGVVVVDEQHRFGVEQRDLLRAKGRPRAEDDSDAGAGSPMCSS